MAGESGVGTTRLVGTFAAGAAERGVPVLRGECVALGEGELPYASVHVSRILAKLGVRSRTEAAAVAHRQGLADAPGGTTAPPDLPG